MNDTNDFMTLTTACDERFESNEVLRNEAFNNWYFFQQFLSITLFLNFLIMPR